MIEGTPQNGCCQHLIYPQRKSQLVPAFQRGSLKCLSEAAFNLLPLCWDSVYMWFLFAPFYRVSVSTALPFSHMQAAKLDVCFQSWMFWGLVFLLQGPRLWSPLWGLNSLIFGENLCNCDYSPVCGLPAQGIWILTYCLFNPPTYLLVVTSYTF